MSQKYASAEKQTNGILSCIRKSGQQFQGVVLDVGLATPGVLGPVLGFLILYSFSVMHSFPLSGSCNYVSQWVFCLVRKIGHNHAAVIFLSSQSSMVLSSTSFYKCFCHLHEKYNK